MSKRKILTPSQIDEARKLHESGVPAKQAVATVSEYAARVTPAKQKMKNLPKGATKTVYVDISSISPENKAKIPAPGLFVDRLRTQLEEKIEAIHDWCTGAHCNGIEICELTEEHHEDLEEQPNILHVEITDKSIRYVFSAPVINTGSHLLHEFMAWHCERATWECMDAVGIPRNGATLTATTFHYKSTAVFSNVLPLKSDGTARSEADYKQDLYASSTFGGTKITRCNIWQPENSPTVFLFVDFVDNKAGDALKRITRGYHRIGDNFYSAREPRQTSSNRPAVLCINCARYGHACAQCESSWAHCLECAGNHRTSDHNIVAKDAPKKCYNCGHAHPATSTECIFYEHRFDRKWIFDNASRYDKTKRKMIYYDTRKKGEAKKTGAA